MSPEIRRAPFVSFAAVAVLLVAALLASAGSVVQAALLASPGSVSSGPYPAHIHSGSCDDLGGVEFPLEDATRPEGGEEGTTPSLVVTTSTTTIEAALTDLLADPHALNVHMSADDMGTYVACGDVGGVVVDSELVIGLAELNDSGLSGIAVLREGADSTDVTFYLSQSASEGDDGETVGTPAGSPAAEADADVTVEIVDFAYGEGDLEVEVGTTVQWVNRDSAPHTVTSDPGGEAFQSGKLDEGDAFTFTFTETGTFEYFCEFHPDMEGTVIVT